MTKPALVVVTPLPRSWSGIATYSARLLAELTREWDVTVVVRDGEAPDPIDGVQIIHAASMTWFHQVSRPFRLLHCIGNSEFHTHVPPLVGRFGGVVLAHEVRLNALHCLRALHDPNPHALSEIVRQRHGVELARELLSWEQRGGVHHHFHAIRTRLDEANSYLLAPAIIGADAVVVHSEFAKRLAEIELQGTIPVSVVPFGHPAALPRRSPAESPITVATFGIVAPEKGAALLVEAFGLAARSHPDMRLRFVGFVDDHQRNVLGSLATSAGVADRVTFVGRVHDDDYAEEICNADVAVQLRAQANGEASAAIADCLAAGVPTIVSDVGGQAELPAHAVTHVLPSITAEELAVVLRKVATDAALRTSLTQAAQRHAAASSFAAAAGAISDLLRSTPER